MIKRLRWRLIVITMVLLASVLGLMIGAFYDSTRKSMENASINALQAAVSERVPPGKPGKPSSLGNIPCFVLEQDPRGALLANGSAYYDLTNTRELEEIFLEAQEAGSSSGILKDRALRFLRREGGRGVRYAFTDISGELDTLASLRITCVMIAIAGLLIFFGISVLLARWAVRPVEQAWDQQRQFVADASHELKTPLTVIMTNAELLNSEGYSPEEKARFSGSILTVSRQMRGLVEELLDQARVDNGSLQTDWAQVDLSRLVSDAVLPFEPLYYEEGRELSSQVQPGITVYGDETRLRQVVEILLDNGCKYSATGSIVQIRLSRQSRSQCMITVQSSGAAMTEQECQDIFKRFYRGDTARSMNRSYGLGLSIAEGIVRQHRGKIWVQSKDGYNTFFVSLPC